MVWDLFNQKSEIYKLVLCFFDPEYKYERLPEIEVNLMYRLATIKREGNTVNVYIKTDDSRSNLTEDIKSADDVMALLKKEDSKHGFKVVFHAEIEVDEGNSPQRRAFENIAGQLFTGYELDKIFDVKYSAIKTTKETQ